jgi:hypothetical protein
LLWNITYEENEIMEPVSEFGAVHLHGAEPDSGNPAEGIRCGAYQAPELNINGYYEISNIIQT